MTETKTLVQQLTGKYGRQRSALLPIMQEIVRRDNYLSRQAMIEIAKELDLSAAEVYGVASFYSFIDIVPRGKYKIRVCKSITCTHRNKLVLQEIEKILKIKVGGTTLDGKFSLLMTNCIGQCDRSPSMLINDKVYTDLTPEKVRRILHSYIHNEDGETEDADYGFQPQN